MSFTAGLDVGSTYTKAIVLDDGQRILGRALLRTGFKLADAAEAALTRASAEAGLDRRDLGYVASTGYGRYQVHFRQLNVTDLTAAAWGARFLFPKTRTVLDVGGQTMKASRLDERGRVQSFRLNDKCAAGTGAFIEKTARYMGFVTEEIGPIVATSTNTVPISGVCAVFAESEVINHLSQGKASADILHGAIVSLVGRSVQLMKRVKMQPEFTLVGGILRFERMVEVVKKTLGAGVNVPQGELVQFTSALGAALVARYRMEEIARGKVDAAPVREVRG